MNRISFAFNKIILELHNPKDWAAAKMITGKIHEAGPGVFEMSLSAQNMQRISRIFTGPGKPVVVAGQKYLDELKLKHSKYKNHRDDVQRVQQKERYPVEPNGKFVPYAHQTKIIGTVLANPHAPIFADCGLGKTGSMARAIEMLIERGEISRGKVLISAPLSILHTSWFDDVTKFTNLRSAILWTSGGNKQVLGQERVPVKNYGPRPEGSIKTKTRTGTIYKHKKSGEIREVVTSLDDPKSWEKMKASWKVALMISGEEIPFGEVTARTSGVVKTREEFLKDQLARKDIDIFLINHDGVRIYEDILKAHQFEWIIVDESTKIKSPKSKVFHAHTAISWNAKRRNILSGTPNPNGFTDLWSQFYFVDRGMTLEPSIKDFLFEYFVPEVVGYINTPGGRKAAVKYNLRSDEQQSALIQRVRSVGIYLEQRDCIDLPERTDMRRVVYMTAEQEASYDRMAIDLVAELKNEKSGASTEADAANVLSKIMKLRQITSGFLIGKNDQAVHLDKNPKWEDLDEFIEELGNKKIVIAAQFREEIRLLMERYRHLNAKAIYGDVPVEERAAIIRDFQQSDSCRCVVLQPQAAAHGITLTAAAHLVFTSLDYNFEYYYQTAKRIERLGQKHPIFVVHSLARYRDGSSTIDEDLLDILVAKGRDRNALFAPDTIEEVANQLTSTLIRQVEARHGKR